MTILTKQQIAKRRRWARALESSTKHTRGLSSADNTAHCCLGVYCVLEGIEHPCGAYPVDAGVDIDKGAGVGYDEQGMLAGVNDGRFGHTEYSHPEIALYLYLTCEAGEVWV